MRIILTIGIALILTTSCQERFDSEKWKIEGDLKSYPFREAMLDDIIKNKKFIGLNSIQIRESLGQPNRIEDGYIFYSITTDYGSDIDPVDTKDLILTVDKDSIIVNVRVIEWRK